MHPVFLCLGREIIPLELLPDMLMFVNPVMLVPVRMSMRVSVSVPLFRTHLLQPRHRQRHCGFRQILLSLRFTNWNRRDLFGSGKG